MPIVRKPVSAPANAPYLPPDMTQEEAWAIKAVSMGNANEAEQGMFWRFLLFKLSNIGDVSYRPDSARDTDFAEGKRFVGLILAKTAMKTPEEITKLPRFAAGGAEDDGEMKNM